MARVTLFLDTHAPYTQQGARSVTGLVDYSCVRNPVSLRWSLSGQKDLVRHVVHRKEVVTFEIWDKIRVISAARKMRHEDTL